jgi:hypothetical protein
MRPASSAEQQKDPDEGLLLLERWDAEDAEHMA